MNAKPGTIEQPSSETGTAGKGARRRGSLGPLRMVWRELIHYPGRMAVAGGALITTAMSTLAIPFGFRQIIDQGFAEGADPSVIRWWFLALLGVVTVLAIATAIRFYSVSWLGERVVADIRLRVQKHLLALSPSFFEENSPKEIASRMTADTAIIEQIVGTTVSVALRNAIMAVGGVIYLFALAPMLTVGLIIAIPVVILPIAAFGRRLRSVSRASQDRVADIGAMTAEVFGALRVVQAFNQEDRELGRFGGAVERTFATAKRRITIRAIMTAVIMFLIFGAITVLMWRGAIAVAEGSITGGTIAAFVVTAGIVAGAFGSLTEVYGDLVRGAGAASRLAELLAERPAISAPARPQVLPVPGRGKLAFESVTFRYPARPEVAALQDFSLSVEPGETVAIVGPSGAGKSTLFLLAERFYDPQSGRIKIDGVPLTSADPAEIRQRIALVPQEGVLFAASARDNLRYGNWAADDEAIWEAARAANADSIHFWVRMAPDCPVASASALPSRARCFVMRLSSFSMKRPVLSMPKASSLSSKRWSVSWRAALLWSSPIALQRCAERIGSSSWTAAGSLNRALMMRFRARAASMRVLRLSNSMAFPATLSISRRLDVAGAVSG